MAAFNLASNMVAKLSFQSFFRFTGLHCKCLLLVQFIVEIFCRKKWKLKIFLMYYIIILHKLILENLRFNLCMDKKSFKYSQTLIVLI